MRSIRPLFTLLALLAATLGTARAQDVASGQETVRRAIHVCAACHGENGVSRTKGVPSLAGQMRQYTIAQLKDFRQQTRAEAGTKAYMWGVSALLDDETLVGLADYYAGLPPVAGKPAERKLARLGKKIFVDGIPERKVRACAACHGDGAEGEAAFPRLAGQRADYLYDQLKLFGTRLRPHGVLMQRELMALKPQELKALAAYIQSL